MIPNTRSGNCHWLQLDSISISYKVSVLKLATNRPRQPGVDHVSLDFSLAGLYSTQLKARHSPIPMNVAEIVAIPSWRDPILYFDGPCMIAFSCFRRLAIPV